MLPVRIRSLILILGSLIGIAVTVGLVPALCVFGVLWGNNLEQNLKRGRVK